MIFLGEMLDYFFLISLIGASFANDPKSQKEFFKFLHQLFMKLMLWKVLGLIFQTSYFICANEQIVGYKVPSFP